jgi:glyoxylase-like metal-dependent hydrolase (beta-lactamase superfamily II)/rhodanese-related sulfurtransferase
MYVEQLYTGCLAEAAYYIESNGEAAIIDPLRESEPYISLADSRGAKIKYIFETHFHADFVSGHIDLAKKTGAKIVFGPTASPNYDAYVAKDGEMLPLGDVQIKVLHTPGHTMESSTFLLIDEQGNENSIFTGDTLFIGDVGRPDLAVKSDLSREDLAGYLFDSLRNKIIPLADEVIVYPGHGAGSACGKMMSKETTDTLGNQKKFNYALRADMTREDFVKAVTDGLVAPPQYFPKNAVLNRMGYESIDEVMTRGLVMLEVNEFAKMSEEKGTVVIDTRSEKDFVRGFVPGAYYMGIDGSFATWVGTLIDDLQTPFLVVADEGREEEVVTRLARVGYDHVVGFLKGGLEAWKASGRPFNTLPEVTAADLACEIRAGNSFNVLDVRKESEYASQHIDSFINFPLDFINQNIDQLDPSQTYYVHCAGGYRSLIASSIMMARGFATPVNILEGYRALVQTDLPTTDYVQPTTML